MESAVNYVNGCGGVGSHRSSRTDSDRSKRKGWDTYSSHDPHLS